MLGSDHRWDSTAALLRRKQASEDLAMDSMAWSLGRAQGDSDSEHPSYNIIQYRGWRRRYVLLPGAVWRVPLIVVDSKAAGGGSWAYCVDC